MAGEEEWAADAIGEMRRLRTGDVIRVRGDKFHVRGRVDDWLVVRYWRFGTQKWDYKCLSPAWWSVFSKAEDFKVRKRRRRKKGG